MIGVDNRLIHCGTYDTITEAAAARRKAEREHFGEFAALATFTQHLKQADRREARQ